MLAALYWHSLNHLPLAVLIVVAVAVVTWWLYPPQVRLLGPIWRWGLPLLRAAALAVLAISILQPAIIRPKTNVERGAVVVLLDDSRSMGVIDAWRSGAQRVALAAALGRLPSGARDTGAARLQTDADRLNSLADAITRARGEVDYARLSERGVDAAQSRLDQALADFQSAISSTTTDASAISGQTNLKNALVNLSAIPTGSTRNAWLDGLRDRVRHVTGDIEQARLVADERLFRNDPQVHDVCMDLSKASRMELASAAISQGQGSLVSRLGPDVPVLGFAVGDRVTPFSPKQDAASATTMPVPADGNTSNLTGAVQAVLDHFQGTPLRALVLYSDGRQVGGDVTVPSGLSASGVPVYTVGVAPLGEVKDLAIVHCDAPSSAFVGETITVRADIHAIGLNDVQSDVICDIDGTKQTRHIALTGDKAVTVEFTQKLATAGVSKISLDVAKVPGETTDENNHVQRWVKVLQDKIKIAAYAGSAGWDFQYVRNALSRSPWAELKDDVLPNADARCPLTSDEILKQDVILLFDVASGSLDTSQWDAVNRLVTDRGGSVILVAGDAHLPGEYSSTPLTSALLPYPSNNLPVWHTWPGERPAFHFTPAPGAQILDALKFDDDAESPQRRWQQLPPFFHFLPIAPLKPNTKALLLESDSSSPVLTESRLGAGRVFFFGANETWRWRYKNGEKDQDRFWMQLIRYAAEAPYAATTGGVSIDADPVSATPRQPIHVRARVLGNDGLPRSVVDCTLKVMQGESVIREQSMTAAGSAGNGRYEAKLSDLPEGDYQLQVDPGWPYAQAQMPLRVQRSTEAEMADVSGDETVLRRLAQSSGGEFLRLDQVDLLPQKLNETHDESSRFVETSLWDSGYLYALVLGCLGVEWAMRKRFGLA
jgi:hypothetical protein